MRRHATMGRTAGAGDQRDGQGGSSFLRMADRLIGDALVAAMILLGFVLCLGAARAETTSPAHAPTVALQR